MCVTRANMGRQIMLGDSEAETVQQEEVAISSSTIQQDKQRKIKRSHLRSATFVEGKATTPRSAASGRLPSARIARSLDTCSPSASEDRVELELVEVELEDHEVLEGPEVELLLCRLVQN